MASCGVLIASRSRALKNQPATDIMMESNAKNVALVPTTRFASRRLPAPMCWPTRMVAAIANPKAPPKSRNMTVLAFEVAASEASPRNWPTQTVLTEPFNVCSTLPHRIGKANSRSPRLREPSTRERDGCIGAVRNLAGTVMPVEPCRQPLEQGRIDVQARLALAYPLKRALHESRQHAGELDYLRQLRTKDAPQSPRARTLTHPLAQNWARCAPYVELRIQFAAETLDIEQRLLQQNELRLHCHVEPARDLKQTQQDHAERDVLERTIEDRLAYGAHCGLHLINARAARYPA